MRDCGLTSLPLFFAACLLPPVSRPSVLTSAMPFTAMPTLASNRFFSERAGRSVVLPTSARKSRLSISPRHPIDISPPPQSRRPQRRSCQGNGRWLEGPPAAPAWVARTGTANAAGSRRKSSAWKDRNVSEGTGRGGMASVNRELQSKNTEIA
ncbi:unnamed protein product [Phaeothamnion confervicola]